MTDNINTFTQEMIVKATEQVDDFILEVNCKYRGTIGARTKDMTDVCCDYAATSGEHRTCLTVVHGEVIDRRGDKYDECLLRVEGEQISHRESPKMA